MSAPSMVHRSGDTLVVRSVVSGDALYDSDVDVESTQVDNVSEEPLLPDCKVKRNYTCSTCDFFTQNPRVYLYHLRDVHDEKVRIYECPNCLYASKHFQKLLRHTKMVHGSSDGVAEARKTRKRSATAVQSPEEEPPEDIEEAMEEMERPAVFKCSVCDFTSRGQAQLSKHEREEHIKTKFFRCSKCTYVTHIKARYTKHVKYHSMPMIKCDMCDFRTPYKWNLDRHCKNHNGKGAFKCSACNFTADIKQSLTVHEMNHHVPPVGQAAGLGVGRRRNKVGASDATAAEEAAQTQSPNGQVHNEPAPVPVEENTVKQKPTKAPQPQAPPAKKIKSEPAAKKESDFIHPDDIIHRANGKVYIKNKCKLCNFKTAWVGEMAKHVKKVHTTDWPVKESKKTPRPIPNLIPIPSQASVLKTAKSRSPVKVEAPENCEPVMSQKDINDICAKSANSALKDFASLFGSEDVFKYPSTSKVPDLIPTSMFTKNNKLKINPFNQKHASFFDRLKEKLELGTSSNLICNICGYESKCLTEQAKHQKICGKETSKMPNVVPIHNISSSRCQFCRQRCKSSADLFNHMQTCAKTIKSYTNQEIKEELKEEPDTDEGELRIDEDQNNDEDEIETKPHPMENKVFVWNDIMVPMDIEVDDSNYEYTEDKIDDNVSLDLSIRTQSPACSENSFVGQENNYPSPNIQHSPVQQSHTTEKIPTHGNDISVAQHKRVFKCPHCTFWASTASRFHVHIVGHLNKKPFECSLCAYRSNWRWDITKHIKLKSVRDAAHETAKVLMTDETGRRNYTKYNKYLTEIPVSSLQGSSETSGGSGTRPRNHDRNSSPSASKSDAKVNRNNQLNGELSQLMKSVSGRQLPGLKVADGQFLANIAQEKKRNNNVENKRTLFKCKKCNFRDASRDILLQHVKGHYQQPQSEQQQQQQQQHHQQLATQQAVAAALASSSASFAAFLSAPPSSQDLSLRGTSPDRDEASVNNSNATKGCGGTAATAAVAAAPFRCGHCNQVSNWKHVIQRHCRLKHRGDIKVVSSKNGQEKIEVEEQIDEPDHIDIPQNGAHKCNVCPFSNDDPNEFDQHLIGHTPRSNCSIKCSFCKYFVSKKEDLFEHLKLHGIFEPDEFYQKTLNAGDVDSSKKFKCILCPYVTNSKSQYTYHKQFHKPRGGQYTCSHCSYNVSKRHLLHQHLKVHGINVAPHRQNGEAIDVDEISDEIEEAPTSNHFFDATNMSDIPLVWISKNGKFSKMFKCRYCPHVNLRKVNIQEHEKMHSTREKNPHSSRVNDVEHRCSECNYICNNAGVLSSHSKVHQGLYGTVHGLVDPTKSDEEQIKEFGVTHVTSDTIENNIETLDPDVDENEGQFGSLLYFCKECPARFLKEAEFTIHKKLHNSWFTYKCDHCSYSTQKPYLLSHINVHTTEYQERTRILKSLYATSSNYPQPKSSQLNLPTREVVWVVKEKYKPEEETLSSLLNKPAKSSINVPLSGTELFQQKSEAQQKHAAEAAQQQADLPSTTIITSKPSDLKFLTLMRGNPDFIYPTYIKNGRTKEKRYKCHKCPSAFEKREQYKIHLDLHGSKQRYDCEHCDYSVKYYANYVQHVKKHKYSNDANAARRNSDENDENSEILDITDEVNQEDDSTLKLSVADQQMLDIMQHRKDVVPGQEDKKPFWCQYCPYMSGRKDAVDNHQKRHVTVSGARSTYICDHCDYSVPQSHFLREHTKLHFLSNKVNPPDGYIICNNLKLCSDETQASNDKRVIFEEYGSKADDACFLPAVSGDVIERFNNNEGEKHLINVQTGDLVLEKKETSDTQFIKIEKDCE